MSSPLDALASALYSACHKDLLPIEWPEYVFRKSPEGNGSEKIPTGKIKQARPRPDQCEVTLFAQTWSSTALGFGGGGGQSITTAYTTVVCGPSGDCCIYFAGRLAYCIKRPNRVFYEDLRAQAMHEVKGAATRYEYSEPKES